MEITEKIYSLTPPFNYFAIFVANFLVLISGYLVVDDYLMKHLNVIIKQTKLRSELVAIIFINMGNGFPELVTGFLYGKKNMACTVYGSIGGLLFIITIVLGASIIFKSHIVETSSNVFYKNVAFLFISYVFVLYIFVKKKLDIIFSSAMIFAYVLFLVYSVILNKNVTDEIETIEPVSENHKWENIFNICLQPLRVLFDVSILNKEKLGRSFNIYFFSLSANFVIFTYFSNQLNLKIFFGFLPAICLLSTLLYFLDVVKQNKIVIDVYCLCVSILWTYHTSEFIVNQTEMMTTRFNISKELSSLIFLAFGNSFADLITNSIAARRGLVRTAIYSSLTSPIHNILFNLGITTTYFSLLHTELDVPIGVNVIFVLFPIVFIPITIFIIAFNYELRNRKLEKELAFVLFTIYGLFVGLLVSELCFGKYC